MRNFRELNIWITAMEVVKDIYLATSDFPTHEQYGLTTQIRRAAVSVASNIAEGSSRRTEADFARFLAYSLGSAYEIETQLIIANDLGYLNTETFNKTLDKLNNLQKQINSLITIVSNRKPKPKT